VRIGATAYASLSLLAAAVEPGDTRASLRARARTWSHAATEGTFTFAFELDGEEASLFLDLLTGLVEHAELVDTVELSHAGVVGTCLIRSGRRAWVAHVGSVAGDLRDVGPADWKEVDPPLVRVQPGLGLLCETVDGRSYLSDVDDDHVAHVEGRVRRLGFEVVLTRADGGERVVSSQSIYVRRIEDPSRGST
jgi:hypothetical protein